MYIINIETDTISRQLHDWDGNYMRVSEYTNIQKVEIYDTAKLAVALLL